MADERNPLATEMQPERESRQGIERKRLDEGGHPAPMDAFDSRTAPSPGERAEVGKREAASPEREPENTTGTPDDASEPWQRDAFGKPEQPQDRPPARPHMTVTHNPEPNPHEIHEKMDGD